MKISKYKHDGDYSYTLGATLTIELLKCIPEAVEEVFINSKTESNDTLNALCEKFSIKMTVSDKVFNILSPKGNCFVIGVFRKFERHITEGNHVVLVNPSDAGNVGTIIRTAVGFHINNIAVISPAVDIFDPKVVRASMGAVFHLNFTYYESYEKYSAEFRRNNMYSFMLRRSDPINGTVFKKPYSLIFGNEATGLPDSFADFTNPVRIMHTSDIDSLNLPIAAAIGMFSATKEEFEV